MRRASIILLAIILAIFAFNDEEIYKKDIRNRLVIQGIGIDIEKDNSYKVTLQAIDTNSSAAASSDGASQPPLQVYTVKGDSIYTAIKTVTESEGKTPLYSQNRIIILGKSITEENMDNVIDFFVRDVENSSSVYVAAAEKTAAEILQTKNGNEYVSARSLKNSIDSYEYDARIFATSLYELINRYNSASKDFAMPLLSVKEQNGEKNVEISGTAVFSNTKYREKISKDDTIYLNIINNEVYNTALSYSMEDNTRISLNVVKSKTKRTVSLRNGKPTFKIMVTMNADISEISGGVGNAMQNSDIEEFKKRGEEYVEKQVKNVISTLHNRYESDVSGLARLLYICEQDFYRKNEKKIDEVMKNSIYEVECEINIRRIGHEFIEL